VALIGAKINVTDTAYNAAARDYKRNTSALS
jgi:hypothetical protein